MSAFLRQYLKLGLRDVLVVHYENMEEKRGFEDEHTTEIVLARKGPDFVRVSVYWHQHFAPWSSTGEPQLGAPESISEQEYLQARSRHDPIDTPLERAKLIAEDNRARQRSSMESRLGALAPNCPKCGGRMARRYSKRGWFWSCEGFPRRCDGAANLSGEAKRLSDELRKL
jgi:hypothetical protein